MAIRKYDDINKLNSCPFWQNFNNIKREKIKLVENKHDSEKVYLVNVSNIDSTDLKYSKEELIELCISLNKSIVGSKQQLRKKDLMLRLWDWKGS